MTQGYSNTTSNTFGVISTTAGGTTKTGAEAVTNAAIASINKSADEINNLLANYEPNNPASLMQSQIALSNYNLSLQVTSAMIKSVTETAKAVAHNVS